MSMDITGVLEFILQHATKQELQFVGEALRRRLERESALGMGQIDVNRMARDMAGQVEKQMGLGADTIGPMSRRLVADMIRIEQPGLSEAEIQRLVDRFVPGSTGRKQQPGALPREMVLAMITQFVSFSTGEMSEQEKGPVPRGLVQEVLGRVLARDTEPVEGIHPRQDWEERLLARRKGIDGGDEIMVAQKQ